MMYRHCLNCKHCEELRFQHRNLVTGGHNNAHCKLKHEYFFASRIKALFCFKFKEKEDCDQENTYEFKHFKDSRGFQKWLIT